MNTTVLIGRLARDPELSYTASQTAMCRFTLAVDRPKRNGENQGADFIRIVAWNRQAETCNRYLSKGSEVAIEGSIRTGSYKNRDGATVYTTDVWANRVKFLSSPRDNDNTEPRRVESEDSFNATYDDVPFNTVPDDEAVPF